MVLTTALKPSDPVLFDDLIHKVNTELQNCLDSPLVPEEQWANCAQISQGHRQARGKSYRFHTKEQVFKGFLPLLSELSPSNGNGPGPVHLNISNAALQLRFKRH